MPQILARLALLLALMAGPAASVSGPATAGAVNYEPTFPPHVDRSPSIAEVFYIEFRARDERGGFGHSFVTLGTLDDAGAPHQTTVLGFVPKGYRDEAMSQFGLPVAGRVGITRSDLYRRPSARLRVRISRLQYERLVGRIGQLQREWQTYALIGRNCNDFIAEIAASIGLATPLFTARYPVDYVLELRALNAGR